MEFDYKVYRRKFLKPLKTATGDWTHRQGVIIRVPGAVDQYCEVAPLPQFGTETLADAVYYLDSLKGSLTADGIPKQFPCVQAAVTSLNIKSEADVNCSFEVTALLSPATDLIDQVRRLQDLGYRWFKLKIGVHPVNEEIAVVRRLLEVLGSQGRLSIDANGVFDWKMTELWLRFLSECNENSITCLEQPMAVGEEPVMMELAEDYPVALALDESVRSAGDIERFYDRGWSGIFVIKALTMGRLDELERAVKPVVRRCMYSSVFETGIGMTALLTFATRNRSPYPMGCGTLGYFDDELRLYSMQSEIQVANDVKKMEAIWSAL